MIRGHGVDIVEVARIRQIISKYGDKFLGKFFGEAEIASAKKYNDYAPFIASRFAAKEAFAKAIGKGFVGFGLSDVTILRDEGKPPYLSFSNKLCELLPDIKSEDFLLSLSHERNYAIASVIWQKSKKGYLE